MKNYVNLKSTLVFLFMVTLYSCNQQTPKQETIPQDQKQTKYFPQLPITHQPSKIVPIYCEGWLEVQKIIDKGLLAFANIDYQQNKIKIALPAYSKSDKQEVFTGSSGLTYVVDIKIPENFKA